MSFVFVLLYRSSHASFSQSNPTSFFYSSLFCLVLLPPPSSLPRFTVLPMYDDTDGSSNVPSNASYDGSSNVSSNVSANVSSDVSANVSSVVSLPTVLPASLSTSLPTALPMTLATAPYTSERTWCL